MVIESSVKYSGSIDLQLNNSGSSRLVRPHLLFDPCTPPCFKVPHHLSRGHNSNFSVLHSPLKALMTASYRVRKIVCLLRALPLAYDKNNVNICFRFKRVVGLIVT